MSPVKYKIRKGDTVAVLTGRDRGKRGKILHVFRDRGRVLVENVNIVKRHVRQSAQGGGGIIEKEAAIHISNVAYVCPKCDAPVKVMRKILEDGSKVRTCKKCGEILDK